MNVADELTNIKRSENDELTEIVVFGKKTYCEWESDCYKNTNVYLLALKYKTYSGSRVNIDKSTLVVISQTVSIIGIYETASLSEVTDALHHLTTTAAFTIYTNTIHFCKISTLK